MSNNKMWGEVSHHFVTYFQWSLQCCIDTAFLAFWVFIQWLFGEWVIKPYQLTGIDSWVPSVIQIIFAIGTIIPICLYFYRDIRIMFIRTNKKIQEEINAENINHDNKK